MLRVGLAFAVAALCSQGWTKPPVSTLSAAEVFRLAEVAKLQSRLADSETLLTALLSDLRSDYRAEALFRLGELRELAGDYEGAASFFRRLLIEQPRADRVRLQLARVLMLQGHHAEARSVLQVINSIALPPEVMMIFNDLSAALRRERPFGLDIALSLAPNSNINQAFGGDSIDSVVGPLEPDEDARPVSGVGIAFKVQGYARLKHRSTPILLNVSMETDLYRSRKYNNVAFIAQAGPEYSLAGGKVRPALLYSERFQGSTRYLSSSGVAVSWSGPAIFAQRTSFEAAILQSQYRNSLQDGIQFQVKGGVEWPLTRNLTSRAALYMQRNSADNKGYALSYVNASLSLVWHLKAYFLLAEVGSGVAVADERLALFPRRRRDHQFSSAATFIFKEWQVARLSPLLRIRRQKNKSTVDIYDFSQSAVEIGAAYSF